MSAQRKLEQHMQLNPQMERREAIFDLYAGGGLDADEATALLEEDTAKAK